MRIRNAKFVGLTFGAGLAIAVSTFAASASTVLTDGTFSNVTATSTFAGTGSGGSFVTDPGTTVTLAPSACTSCGNPGAALQGNFDSTISTAIGAITAGGGYIDNLLHYTPSIAGAIFSINASADKDVTVTGISGTQEGNSLRILIQQNGNYYLAAISEPAWTAPGTTGFQTFSVSGLSASSFVEINFANGFLTNSAHPDFSSTGVEIFFGVDFQAQGVDGANSTAVYDNLDITINPTPLPAALPLFASGLGAMGLLGWRRKRKSVAALAAV
jgi:hypothetical protein